MAANDEDKLVISKELADKLKINEETLAQKLGAIISPIFIKKLDEAKTSELSKNLIEATKTLQAVGKDVFSKITAKTFDAKSAVTEKVGNVVSGIGQAKDNVVNKLTEKADDIKQSNLYKSLAGFFTGKKETKPEEEKNTKSPGLFQDLFKSLTGFLKKDKEPKAEEKKSLLEEENVKDQPVIVSNFSQQSLDALSTILPEAITKGTQHLADSFKELLEKIDKLIEAVKDIEMGGGGGGGGMLDDVLDMLPGRRRRGRLPGRGTRARNKKAKELRRQRAEQRKIKANQGKPSKTGTIKEKISSKIGKVKDVITTSAGKEGTILNKVTKAGAGVAEKVSNVASAAKDVGGRALSSAKDVGGRALSSAKDVGGQALNKLGKVGGVVSDVGKGAVSNVGKYGGTALKYGGRALGAAGAILGAGMEFADRKSSGQTTTQAAVGTGGTAAGAGLGAWGGAAAGAAIGSVVPVVGTVIGGVTGAILGGIGGGWLGGKAADKLTGAEETEKEKLVVDEWKEGIEKSEPKLGKEYVATYEKLPDDQKKKINTTLTVNWEGDRESALDTVKKKLQEANPKLLYGDKISPELTETLDKKVAQAPAASPTPEITVTKPNPNSKSSPAISPEQTIKENIGSSLGDAKAKQVQQNKEKIQKLTEGLTPLPPPSKASLDTPLAFGIEGINAGKPTPELMPYVPEGEGEGEESEYDKPAEQPQGEKKTGIFGNATPALGSVAAAAIPGIGLLGGAPGIASLGKGTTPTRPAGPAASAVKGGGKWGTALKLGLTAATAGTAGALAFGSKLFGPKNEPKPEVAASTESPASATITPTTPQIKSEQPTQSTETAANANAPVGVPNASSTWKAVDFTAKGPAPIVSKTADKPEGKSAGDGILKSIADNTKKTSDEVAKLANAFLVFSKMLPGSLANLSVGSESSPTIINQQSGGSDKSLRSTQIAKAGNQMIQSFRDSLESTRQVPA